MRKLILANRVTLLHSYWCIKGLSRQVQDIRCGKTTTLRRLFEILEKEGKILVSKSLSVDKDRATLPKLIAALFYDLSTDKEIKIPRIRGKTRTGIARPD